MKTKLVLWLFFILGLAAFLRFYRLGHIPASLHGDEVGVGYNAYSLLISGTDEYGKRWPVSLRADVTPLIFYATMPAIAVFGRTDFAVRLPSAVVGTLSVLIFFFFVKELLKFIAYDSFPDGHPNFLQNQHVIYMIALLSSLFLAITPWHIQLSRITHDAGYGLFMQLLALWSFFYSLRTRKTAYLSLSCILFGLSFYAYHAPRLTSPLLLFGLILSCYKYLKHIRWPLALSLILFALVTIPVISDFLAKPFTETRIGGINILIRETPDSPLLSYFPQKLVGNFLNQFSFTQLFLSSNTTRYFNLRNVGLLYITALPFIFLGFTKGLVGIRHRMFMIGLLVIATLPGSLTLGKMNAGRIYLLFPFLEFLFALGTGVFIFDKVLFPLGINFKKISISCLLVLNIWYFSVNYFLTPLKYLSQWQYGLKQLALAATAQENKFDSIVITDQAKQAYIYVLFYGQKNPSWLKTQIKTRHDFIGFTRMGKYEFRAVDWDRDKFATNTLLAGTPQEIPQDEMDEFIMSPQGDLLYGIVYN